MDEEINKENEKLKEIIELKSDLISISAHELRTSLSALKWMFKMFLDRDLGEITAEQESFLKRAYESNERMIKLVSETLSASKLEDATITYKFEKSDIIKLVDDVVFEFIGESHKQDIEIIFLKPTEIIPEIIIDPSKIRVVLQNLVENAIKYSNKGGKIFISIRSKPASPHESSGAGGPDQIEFSVRDAGIGIKKEDEDKIFSKFFRAENAKEKAVIGTGLGLMVTKKIVEHHGGKIWFENNENGGVTFYFTLPVK